jgi:hypothetical protein
MLNKKVSAILREQSYVKRFAPNGNRPPAKNSVEGVAA